MDRSVITHWFKGLQDEICQGLEQLDEVGKFQEDAWERPGGGGGRTRILEGKHIEKGGVNFSAVEGKLPLNIAKSLELDEADFFATGVSIVLHPSSPMLPIIHMNVRYFETGENTWWFGGGIDLTPHYVDKEDAKYFHNMLKTTCDKHDPDFYPEYKTWADDYFYIKHRKETRGIGGIFFDKLGLPSKDKNSSFEFTKDVGKSFLPIYTQIFKRNFEKPYSKKEKEWQMIRRGRYVEFNLVWDRGTKFGLETDGRTESILMSLPKEVNWLYNHIPAVGSEESKTQALLVKGINWV